MPAALIAFFILVGGFTVGDQAVQVVSLIDLHHYHTPGYGMRVWTAPRWGARAKGGVCQVRFFVTVLGGGRARLNTDGELLPANTGWSFDREIPARSLIVKHFWMYDELTGEALYQEQEFRCGRDLV